MYNTFLLYTHIYYAHIDEFTPVSIIYNIIIIRIVINFIKEFKIYSMSAL